MVACGPVDFWEGCMTAEELLLNICSYRGYLAIPPFDVVGFDSLEEERLNISKKLAFVEHAILESFYSDEKPHTIRFFAIPDPSNGNTEICCVAKVSNNGITFVFTNNLNFAKHFDSDDIYQLNESSTVMVTKI